MGDTVKDWGIIGHHMGNGKVCCAGGCAKVSVCALALKTVQSFPQ